jgi:hypothetical protein
LLIVSHGPFLVEPKPSLTVLSIRRSMLRVYARRVGDRDAASLDSEELIELRRLQCSAPRPYLMRMGGRGAEGGLTRAERSAAVGALSSRRSGERTLAQAAVPQPKVLDEHS